MSLLSTTDQVSYACNGLLTTFDVTFYFILSADVEVILTDSSGASTTLVQGSAYTITGAGTNPPTGQITTTTAYATGYTLTIQRNCALTQPQDMVEGGAFPVEAIETSLDRLTMIAQQQQADIDRTVRASDATTGFTGTFTPIANYAVAINAAGTGVQLVPTTGLTTPTYYRAVSSYTNLATAIAAGAGAILIDENVDTNNVAGVAAAMSIPATTTLIFLDGFTLDFKGQVVTCSGLIQAGNQTIFSDSVGGGTITFSSNGKSNVLNPYWWGASAAASAATNGTAFNAWATCLASYPLSRGIVPAGSYSLSTGIAFTQASVTAANGDMSVTAYGATLTFAGADTVGIDLLPGYDSSNESYIRSRIYWAGGRISGANTTGDSIGISTGMCTRLYMQDMWVENWTLCGLDMTAKDHCKFSNITFDRNGGNSGAHIIVPDHTLDGRGLRLATQNPQEITFDKIVTSRTGYYLTDVDRPAVLVKRQLTNSVFKDCSFAGRTNVSTLELYTGYNAQSDNIRVENCNFENGSGTGFFIKLYDTTGTPRYSSNIMITGCTFGAALKAIYMEYVFSGSIINNSFRLNTAGSMVEFGANCYSIAVAGNTTVNRHLITAGNSITIGASTDRREILYSPSVDFFGAPIQLESKDNQATTGGTALDVPTLVKATAGNRYSNMQYINPVGYYINVVARDAGSAGGACGIEVRGNATTSTATYNLYLNLQGAVNDTWHAAQGFVPCDKDGKIEYNLTATGSGPGTLDFRIFVIGAVYSQGNTYS